MRGYTALFRNAAMQGNHVFYQKKRGHMNGHMLRMGIICCLMTACVPQAEMVKTHGEMNEVREDLRSIKTRVHEVQKRVDQDQKRIDAIDTNVKATVDIQRAIADYGTKTDQLTTDIQLMQGKIEENNYRVAEIAQKSDDRGLKIAEFAARIDALESRIKILNTAISALTSSTTITPLVIPDKNPAPVQKMPDPSEAYRLAKMDYDKGNFDLALAGFQNFIVQFSTSSQVDHAQYWIGECYYAQKDFAKSREAFAKVISAYPKSEKLAAAKLKLGLIAVNEKNLPKAKELLNQVIKEHPGTNESEIAKDRLGKLAK